ncbi:MAG: Arc family DNA-binding protein [Gammaproteobacteria bacterium]|nr:Arc family DNA-binding protein [Gammaproteobacteria bacterium]MYB36658.1 Arc family DNA-binding protein [Gammaproteobacteria bacterium]
MARTVHRIWLRERQRTENGCPYAMAKARHCSGKPAGFMPTKPKRHQLLLRLPLDLHGQVVEAARRYGRSTNSEIVARLDHSLRGLTQDQSAVEPPLLPYVETTFRRDLSAQETQLLLRFRQLSPRQREGLMDLLTR